VDGTDRDCGLVLNVGNRPRCRGVGPSRLRRTVPHRAAPADLDRSTDPLLVVEQALPHWVDRTTTGVQVSAPKSAKSGSRVGVLARHLWGTWFAAAGPWVRPSPPGGRCWAAGVAHLLLATPPVSRPGTRRRIWRRSATARLAKAPHPRAFRPAARHTFVPCTADARPAESARTEPDHSFASISSSPQKLGYTQKRERRLPDPEHQPQ